MPIPDLSKFDFQSIVDRVKSIIAPEITPPNVSPSDPIGAKKVQISNLLQKVADEHIQIGKDLTQINNLLNSLYSDLEATAQVKTKVTTETVEVGEPSQEKVAEVEIKKAKKTTTTTSKL